MKKSYILLALAMVAALSMVSCKNNKKAQEPTQEEVEQMKQALTDTVLAWIDKFADVYCCAYENGVMLRGFELTEQEKLIKPDYLLDPAQVNNLVTRNQKICALAIYLVENDVRKIYDMPLDETNEAIAKLVADLNYPIEYDGNEIKDRSLSDRIKAEYNSCKENGTVSDFWVFQEAFGTELNYLIAQNPDLIFNRITDEQWQANVSRIRSCGEVITYIADYDEELAAFRTYMNKYRVSSSNEEWEKINATKESAKQFRIANKDNYSARRKALLQ